MGLRFVQGSQRIDREDGRDRRDEPVMQSVNEVIETFRQERFSNKTIPIRAAVRSMRK